MNRSEEKDEGLITTDASRLKLVHKDMAKTDC